MIANSEALATLPRPCSKIFGLPLPSMMFYSWVGISDALAVVRHTGVCLLDFFCSGIQFYVLLSPYFCFISFLYLDLYILGDDA